MIALKTLGIICIILVCFAGAAALIVDALSKPKPTKIGKDGKRELKINRISYWEYLIIIIPLALLLIGLFTSDREEKLTSFTILGIGYAFLLLSSYNNRIVIPWVFKTVLISCITLAIIAYLLSLTNYNYKYESGSSALTVLFFPLITLIYLLAARQLIKITTKTYPLSLDRYFRPGNFSRRLQRKATYWDLLWTLWNITGYPAIIIYSIFLLQ
jgi:hypothetical protein